MSICDGRVVIVTGAGRGLGRAHALELARQGALVVVNDLGVELDGTGATHDVADSVVAEIEAAGGKAVASVQDVSDWDAAGRVIEQAITTFGRVDALVNNAGILRDRMFVNMSIEEWDDVIRVHLRGAFAVTRRAAAHWRDRSKEGEAVDARVVNTTSTTGLYGNVGQANYGAAKAALANLTINLSHELGRYGVAVNGIAPLAATRMTAKVLPQTASDGGFDPFDPGNVSPLVAWLCSRHSGDVTGRIFNVRGGQISVAESWAAGPAIDIGGRWDASQLFDAIPSLLEQARPNPDFFGQVPTNPT
jgi:NAD(P)-dependent dehydrogenase (short-subunit alcohol dehydrogenase family)